MNRKRVQRLWRDEGLRVRPWQPKRRWVGISTVPAERLRAERPNHVWARDFIFDATSDGRPLKDLSMCDEFTRVNLARRLGRSITADDVVGAPGRGSPRLRTTSSASTPTTALTSSPLPFGIGAASTVPAPPTSHPARRRSNAPEAITINSAGMLYVDDTYNYRVVKLDPNTWTGSNLTWVTSNCTVPESPASPLLRSRGLTFGTDNMLTLGNSGAAAGAGRL